METHFDRLGLTRRFALDAQEVERHYLQRSRELHPDYHQQGSSAEQRASLELSAALNDANATLREPFRRAEYLLTLEGGPTAAQHKEMAPEFLEEMLDLRMEIEDLREAGDRSSAGWKAMEEQLTVRRQRLVDEIGKTFARLEAGEGKKADLLVQVRQHLNAAKYIQGLLRDLRAD